jgi:glucose-1-phosphate cytidylyltransferase
MKVVLFCGGLGLRIREAGEHIPKPMVPIGARPILWHVMRYYAHFGHTEFVLCLGHRAEVIKRYFLDYDERLSNDFTLNQRTQEVKLLSSDARDWSITFLDTGVNASVGQRLRAARKHLENEEMFLANYSDNLTDLQLPDLISHAKTNNKVATFTSVKPSHSFHLIESDAQSTVTNILPASTSNIWINGGFFVLKNEVFDYLHEEDELVGECFERLTRLRELSTYKHNGFWAAMDTFKEKMALEDMHAQGHAPWEVWRKDHGNEPLRLVMAGE